MDGHARRSCLPLWLLILAWPGTASAEWVVAGLLGHSATRASTVVLALPSQNTHVELEKVGFRNESFVAPVHYAFRIGWSSNARPWFGVDVEFMHNKVYARTGETVRVSGMLNGTATETSIPMNALVQRLSISHGLNFLLASAVFRRDVWRHDGESGRRLVMMVRGGAGSTFPHGESTIGGMSRDQYDAPGLGVQGGAGAEFFVWRKFGVVGEYKFTWARPTITIPGGQATIPAATHHAMFGLTQRF